MFFSIFIIPTFFIGCFLDHNRSQSQCLPLHENADLHGRENLAGYSVWFVATLIPEENRFVSWLTPPNNPKHIFLWKSLFFASCFDLIEVGAFMRFNDPLRTHVFGSAPNKRKPCIFVVSCFCQSFFLNTLLGTITYPYYQGKLKSMIFSFFPFWWDTFVCSLEASFSEMFLFQFFHRMLFFELFFLNLEVYTYTNQSVSFSIITGDVVLDLFLLEPTRSDAQRWYSQCRVPSLKRLLNMSSEAQ